MIFGAETPEVLETKINNLDEQINDAEENVKTTKEEVRLFYLCLHRFTFNHSSTHTNLIEFLGLNISLKRELLLRFPPQLSNITYWLMVIDSYLLQWCRWSCCYAVKYDPLESLSPPPPPFSFPLLTFQGLLMLQLLPTNIWQNHNFICFLFPFLFFFWFSFDISQNIQWGSIKRLWTLQKTRSKRFEGSVSSTYQDSNNDMQIGMCLIYIEFLQIACTFHPR